MPCDGLAMTLAATVTFLARPMAVNDQNGLKRLLKREEKMGARRAVASCLLENIGDATATPQFTQSIPRDSTKYHPTFAINIHHASCLISISSSREESIPP